MHLHTDVLIVGGGTAGVTAALAAASHGARVVLAEAGQLLGGVGISAGVHAYFMGLHVGLQPALDKQSRELAHELGSTAVGFHPEAMKIALREKLTNGSIHVLYQALAVEVQIEQNRVMGVVFETPEQTVEVTATVTLDSTGNGDICTLAGASVQHGRDWDDIMQCYSVTPRYFKEDGKLHFNNYDAGWVDSTSSRDISRALLDGRRLIWQLPELESNDVISIASLFGAREGHLVQGAYTLTLDDLIMDRRFDDVVMKCYSHYDNHATDMANESPIAQIWTGIAGAWNHRLGCDVPYRSFVPDGVDGLLIACRALSMDHDVSTSLRMQPDMHAVGEVAGTAAALCCQSGVEPRRVDVLALQQAMVQRGVLEEGDLTRASAPWVTLTGSKRGDGAWTLESVRQPETIGKLIEALGTEDDGSALWWLWKTGVVALPALRDAYAAANGTKPADDGNRRGLAIALALLGDDRGAADLVRSIKDRDADAPPGYEPRIPPRWIASLIALKALKDPSAAETLIRRLPTNEPTNRLAVFAEILYVLQYMIEAADRMSDSLKAEAVGRIEAMLLDPAIGEDWYSGGGDCSRIQAEVSIRWNIELTALYARCVLGQREAIVLFGAYKQDRRLFVRHMACKLEARLLQAGYAKLQPGKAGSQ